MCFSGESKHIENSSALCAQNQKYWEQRHSLFSLYDAGIWMNHDAWYSVTPEAIANRIAQHTSQASPMACNTIVDCFAGAGGNVIAFAKSDRWTNIHAIESDANMLQCAKHNASLYGVSDRITWHLGDALRILPGQLLDACQEGIVFASPPWGGPMYRDSTIFDLACMQPYKYDQLDALLTQCTKNFIMYLPRSSDLRQLLPKSEQLHDGKVVRTIIHYCMYGASKVSTWVKIDNTDLEALCVYSGEFDFEGLFSWPFLEKCSGQQ